MLFKMDNNIFLAINRRRMACPLAVQHLWDAVKVINFQRQIPDIDRITKYMSKVHNMSADEVSTQLSYCVRDGLLILTKRVGHKGSKVGVETEGYKLPEEKVNKDSHEWYCFQCHRAGDVINCTSCYRVYHLMCIENEDLSKNDIMHTFICNICKSCATLKDTSKKIKKSQLNRLLHLTARILRKKIPSPWSERKVTATAPSIFVSDRLQIHSPLMGSDLHLNMKSALKDQDLWRIDLLIFKSMDFQIIEDKADNDEYKNVREFQADILTFVHNIIIFQGVNSSLADNGRLMLKDCNQYLEDIIRCHYCYKYSIQKKSKFWFCKPCKPPHELVYAKQENFPYMPAKVLKIEGDIYEVRFFGGEHQLGVIDKSQVRPISEYIRYVPSLSWNKASEELRRYKLQLDKILIGITQLSSSSSSSSEDEEEPKVTYLPKMKHNEKVKDKKEIELITNEVKVEAFDQETESKNKEKDKVEKEMVLIHNEANIEVLEQETETKDKVTMNRKRGRPFSLEKKCSPSKKIVKNPSVIQNTRPKNINTEKISSGSSKITVESTALACNTTVQGLSPKINKISEETISTKHKSTLKKKFPRKKNKIEELKDPDAVEDKTVNSSYHRLVRSVKVETEPVCNELPESRINKCVNCGKKALYHCCWNTSYCNRRCQLTHWNKGHNRYCRRKK